MATIIEPEHNRSPLLEENQRREPRSASSSRQKRLRSKGFSWRRHWPIVALAGAIGFLWLLPVFIAHTPIIDSVIRSAASELNGTVHVRSASLGWFSPVVLRGVEVRGADGQPILEIPEARGDASLLTMLFNKARLGHFRVHEPKLTLVLREGGSNLEDAIAAYLKSTAPATMDVAVEITDGAVLVQEAHDQPSVGSRRSWQIDKLQLSWTDPLDLAKPAQGKVSGVVASSGRSGKIDAALTLRTQGDEATLKTDNVPLAMFESLARRWVPGLRVDGRLTSALEAHWDGKNPDGKTTVGGRVTGEELQLALPALGRDKPKLARVQAGGQVVWQGGQAQCDRMTLESDVGSLSFSGRLDLRGSAGSNLAATLGQSWDASGQLDLARLAALLPNTLRIHKSAEITSGQVQLKLASRRGKEGMAWQGSLGASNLAATRDGRKLLWQQPILLTLDAYDTRQGMVIKSLKCVSDFLSVSASGTRDELSGSAEFDLRKLADQTSGFVDLGGLGVTGDGWVNFDWKRSAQGTFDAMAELQIDRFQWTLPDRQPWTESRVHASLVSTVRTDFAAKHQIDSALLKLESGQDQWEVRLLQPVAVGGTGVSPVSGTGVSPVSAARTAKMPVPPPTGTLSLKVHSTGELTQWQRRLATWLAAHQWKLGGRYALDSEVSLSPNAIGIRQASLSVDELVLENPSWKVREPHIEVVGAGWQMAGGGKRIEMESASLKASTLVADAKKLVAYFPPHDHPIDGARPELSGTITCDAALDRLHAWARLNLADQTDWRVAGNLSSRVEFQQTGGPIFAKFQAALTNLALTHPSGQRYQEQEVRLTGSGSYNYLSRSLVIDQAQLTSGTVAGSASGRVAEAGGKTEMQLSGKIDYDLQRVAELLRSRYGDGIRLAGRGSRPIALRGPWSLSEATASASLNWAGADLYGFQIGPGELQASLGRGVVQVQPLVLTVNEGQVQLVPRVRLAPGPAVLVLAPGRVAEQVRLTPGTGAFALQYLVPVLAGAVSTEGRISIDLDGCQVPLANPAAAEVAGRLTIHSAQVGPGYLLGELGAFLGRQPTAQLARESVVPFRMTEGRVYHKDLTLALADVTIRTSGFVGVDQTINMVAAVSIPAQSRLGGAMPAALQGQALQLPITGTLRQPRIDRSALGQAAVQAAGQTLQNAARNSLQDQLNRQLPGLLRPAPKR